MSAKRQIRCAVYTRKSTEEGLEQEFNSLDAQREACEAYVASQKAEGWIALRDRYDDGGYFRRHTGTPGPEAPARPIEAGAVDVVVVYKIDRLSRSLMDFAKLVEVFDRKSVTFVTVTQSFNTTTSMGRLTLNILLSFAQFEREVIGERIRDKFAASRKKGMWMGGNPPLGYESSDRKLVVNPAEAETVRLIFQRYLDLGCARLLCTDLRREAWCPSIGYPSTGADARRQADGAKRPLLHPEQPRLHRRDHAQGRLLSGRARSDRAARAVRCRPAAAGRASSAGVGQDARMLRMLLMPVSSSTRRGAPCCRPTRSRREDFAIATTPAGPTLKGERSKAAISRISAPPFEAFMSGVLERLGFAGVTRTSPHRIVVRRIDILSTALPFSSIGRTCSLVESDQSGVRVRATGT